VVNGLCFLSRAYLRTWDDAWIKLITKTNANWNETEFTCLAQKLLDAAVLTYENHALKWLGPNKSFFWKVDFEVLVNEVCVNLIDAWITVMKLPLSIQIPTTIGKPWSWKTAQLRAFHLFLWHMAVIELNITNGCNKMHVTNKMAYWVDIFWILGWLTQTIQWNKLIIGLLNLMND